MSSNNSIQGFKRTLGKLAQLDIIEKDRYFTVNFDWKVAV